MIWPPFPFGMLEPRFYRLEGTTPVLCKDLLEWGRALRATDHHVAFDMIGDVEVSTIFLGMDHRHLGEGPPILFETMVFGGARDGDQRRYCTWDEAEAGHAAKVAEVRRSMLRVVK